MRERGRECNLGSIGDTGDNGLSRIAMVAKYTAITTSTSVIDEYAVHQSEICHWNDIELMDCE